MHRLKAGEAVARPASRHIGPVVDSWIAELAGEDETMQEYFTAESDLHAEDLVEDPGGDADASDSHVSRLEAQVKDLQDRLAASQAGPAVPTLMRAEPKRAMAAPTTFAQPGTSLEPHCSS